MFSTEVILSQNDKFKCKKEIKKMKRFWDSEQKIENEGEEQSLKFQSSQ